MSTRRQLLAEFPWWFLGLLLAAIVAVAAVVRCAEAQTYPSDVVGHTAAQCASMDAFGVPVLCSPTAPLPITGGALTGAGLGTSSAGNLWFLSQPPNFQPFNPAFAGVTGANFPPDCFFLDDVNVACFSSSGAALDRRVYQWRSYNGGVTFTPVARSGVIFSAGQQLNSATRLPTTGYAFISSETATSPFYTSIDGIAFTSRTFTGAFTNPIFAMGPINVGTILARGASPAPIVLNDDLCRTSNSGVSWTCAVLPAITGYTGTGGFTFTPGGQSVIGVSASVWLAIGSDGNDGTLKIIRSTNDGVAWTQVFSAAAVAGQGPAVNCLSSTLCLAVSDQRIFRSTNAGVTWAAVVSTAPDGAATFWNGIAAFNDTTAVALPQGGAANTHFYRTVDGGITWTDTLGSPVTCPASTAAGIAVQSVAVRNGRAIVVSRYNTLAANTAPCAYYSAIGTGGIPAVGPLGTAWNIGADGNGPVSQGNPLNAFTVAPVQGPLLFNSQTTGVANTAVVVTITGVANQRAHLYRVEASCSAGTSTITITDGGTTVWSTVAAEVGVARFRQPFSPAGLTGSTAATFVVTLATCGVGNAGTLIVQADRY